MLDCDIVRDDTLEATARGAAYFAGLAVGFWKDEAEVDAVNAKLPSTTIRPSDGDPQMFYGGSRRDVLAQYQQWQKNVKQTACEM